MLIFVSLFVSHSVGFYLIMFFFSYVFPTYIANKRICLMQKSPQKGHQCVFKSIRKEGKDCEMSEELGKISTKLKGECVRVSMKTIAVELWETNYEHKP